MAFNCAGQGLRHFIRSFPSDPDRISTLADIQAIEQVPAGERFPCVSPIDALETIAGDQPDGIALTWLPNGVASDVAQRWTYRQYHQEVAAAADHFRTLGLQRDESVIFLLPNVPELLFGIWAAEAVGIAAPINPFLQPEQIAGIAREANARILVTLAPGDAEGDDFFQKARDVADQLGLVVITVSGRDDLPVDGGIPWRGATPGNPVERIAGERVFSGDEIAAYFHTGGTTGTPKLAQHTHRMQVVNVCQMAMTGPVSEGEEAVHPVTLCGLPLFHVNAVFVSALSSILSGGELVLAGRHGFRNKTLIRDFWPLVEQYKVTFFAGVPTVYAALLEQSSREYDVSSLSHCACGAAPMPVSMLRTFHERTGADIMEGYGMTETVTCATAHYYHGPRHVGSIGMRLPYQQVRAVVVDGNGAVLRDCGVNEIGVLLLRGPNVIPAYKQAFANEGAWPEKGWLNSGDMGRVDADGYVWLTGRAKDLIIRGGHNIDPLITEDSLTGHPDVEMAAAVGMPDAYAGELPIAYVQLRPGATVTAEELKAFARDHAAERAAAPVEVIIRDELPKTAVGKTFKPPLRKDAIARAYQRNATEGWPRGSIDARVVEDDIHGLKVLLSVAAADTMELENARQLIAPRLEKLAYAWEVIHAVV